MNNPMLNTPNQENKKIIAIDYKGKHFILTDEDMVDDYDVVDEYVSVEKVIGDDRLLKNYIEDCRYYGIPLYYGNNKELWKKINKLESEIIYE